MHKKVVLFMVFSIAAVFAQPSIEHQKIIGGNNREIAYSIAQTMDGDFILAGFTESIDISGVGHYGYSDYFIVELNPTLEYIVWENTFGGISYEWAKSVQQTSDSGYVIAGTSCSWCWESGREYDYWIIRLRPSGGIEEYTFGGSNDDKAYSIQQTTDGGFIVAGCSKSTDGEVEEHYGYFDYWILKLNSCGVIEWQRALGGSAVDTAFSIQQTTDGGYIIAGCSNSTDEDVLENKGGYDYWIVKLNSSGGIEWRKNLGGTGNDIACSVQQTTDGGYIIAGYSNSTDEDVLENKGGYDYWIVKLNSSDSIEWRKNLGGSDDDKAYSVQQTTDGGYIIAGCSNSTDGDISEYNGNYDYWIVKLNSSGGIEWEMSLGDTSAEKAYSIQQTTDGGYIIAGTKNPTPGDISGTDIWVVKLSPEDEIKETKFPTKHNISFRPNPFNSSVAITAPAGAELEIYDLRGNVVHTDDVGATRRVAQQEGDASHRPYIWTPDETTPSGIYLVRASVDGKTIVKRIMYIK